MKTDTKKDINYYLSLPYSIVLRRDEDGDWVSRVDELPGCIAHGSTEAEAIAALNDIKKAWIEDALEVGDAIAEPASEEGLPSGKWVQRVPRSLHKKVAELARKENVSLNQFVATTLAEAVGQRSQPATAEPRPIGAAHHWVLFHAAHHGSKSWTIHQRPANRIVNLVQALEFAGAQVETKEEMGLETKGHGSIKAFAH